MSSYIYARSSIADDANYAQLHQEILEQIVSPVLTGITDIDAENVRFDFDSSLSGGQITTLDNIISEYTPIIPEDVPEKFADVYINKTISSSAYSVCGSFFFPGTLSGGSISKIKVLSNLTNGSIFYIKIYDKNNKKVIAETSFTNTNSAYNDVGTLSNLPFSSTIIEIQAKSPSSSKAYIDNASIF